VFAFTLVVTLATGVVFGLAPALQAAHTDPQQGLRKGRGSIGSSRQSRLRNALVISEVSLACILLIGAGLMLRSFVNQMKLDRGFEQEHILTANLSLPHASYMDRAAVGHFYDLLASKLSGLPGVESAGVGTDLPWTGYDENAGFTIEGKPPPPHQDFHARYHAASPDYFRALGTPLFRGRFFTAGDKQDAPTVFIINRAMAERYWPNEEALGKRITFEDTPKEKDWIRVVGVVGDVKDQPNSAAAEPAFWWPILQHPDRDMSIVVRSNSDPRLLADEVRNTVRQLDPALAVADLQLMDRIVDASIATPRMAFALVGLFAGLAILLAAIGTYGVISYAVGQRTSEFGVRMALGAARSDVMRLVLSHAVKLAALGTGLGVVAALVLARLLKSLIFNVSTTDPATYVAVAGIVMAAALLAGYLPARRATGTDPMNALRAE
jgi:predicted permease